MNELRSPKPCLLVSFTSPSGVVDWQAASIRHDPRHLSCESLSHLFVHRHRAFAPLPSIPPVLLPSGSLPGDYAAAAAASAAQCTLLVHCSSHFNLLVRFFSSLFVLIFICIYITIIHIRFIFRNPCSGCPAKLHLLRRPR
jgi:hypothetical protein